MLDRLEVDRLASEAVLKARTEVIVTNRFYGVLVSNVEPVLSRDFPTAATNGKRHFFNPDFVNKLTPKQLAFVQRHESEHDARHHSTRRGNRDPKEWNIACDFAINIDLVDEIAKGANMEVPPEEILGGEIFCDAKYRGMSAEDIYRCRELDRQRAEQEKQKQQSQESEQSQDGDDDADADSNEAGDETGDETSDETDSDAGDEAGGDAGDEAGEGDEADGEGDEAGDEAGDDTDGKGNGEGDETDGDADSDAGNGEGGEAGEDAEGEGEGTGEGQGDAEGEASEPKSVTGHVPGGLGEVLDAADDPVEASDEEAKWERVVRQAASIGKGDTPGHIRREIENANQPKQDWREVLRSYFDGGAARIETWNRPNRRFVGSGTILPGSQREGLNTVCVLIDTSGSVDDVALECVAAETQAALDEHIIDRLVVISGDVKVNHATEQVPGDEVDFDFKGRGGTEMRPLFDWVKENVDDPSLIVCFTDGYIESEAELGDQPACPVLWAYHGYPDAVRGMIANTPWQEPAIDVGSH